jgi:hypothetical protein
MLTQKLDYYLVEIRYIIKWLLIQHLNQAFGKNGSLENAAWIWTCAID